MDPVDSQSPPGAAGARLLSDEELARSEIVANLRMNRERVAVGPNSYAKDLGLNPLEFLIRRVWAGRDVAWLDLCCGEGNALIEAARFFAGHRLERRVALAGVDLVDMFLPVPQDFPFLNLHVARVDGWRPEIEFDLVTC